MNKELAARRYGYVQVAVAAYIYLLEHLRDADSALFAREVICQQVASPTHFYHRAVPAACASIPPTVKSLVGTLLANTSAVNLEWIFPPCHGSNAVLHRYINRIEHGLFCVQGNLGESAVRTQGPGQHFQSVVSIGA